MSPSSAWSAMPRSSALARDAAWRLRPTSTVVAPTWVATALVSAPIAPGPVTITTSPARDGLRSITAALGADYRRLRLGIGHPGVKELVAGYALHDFSKAERQWLDPLIDAIAESAPLLADGDDQGVMNRVAVLTRPPEPKSKPETTKD